MPFNDLASSFAPLSILPPAATGPTFAANSKSYINFLNQTTAQLTTNNALTSVALAANASTLVNSARQRTTGILIILPSDQAPIAIGNTPLVGPFPDTLISLPGTVVNTSGVSSGALLYPGNTMFISPMNDPLYAYPVGALASQVFYENV